VKSDSRLLYLGIGLMALVMVVMVVLAVFLLGAGGLMLLKYSGT
jgi:hypothetical protein